MVYQLLKRTNRREKYVGVSIINIYTLMTGACWGGEGSWRGRWPRPPRPYSHLPCNICTYINVGQGVPLPFRIGTWYIQAGCSRIIVFPSMCSTGHPFSEPCYRLREISSLDLYWSHSGDQWEKANYCDKYLLLYIYSSTFLGPIRLTPLYRETTLM